MAIDIELFNHSTITSSDFPWSFNTSTFLPSDIYTEVGTNQPNNGNSDGNIGSPNNGRTFPTDVLILIILSSILAVINIMTNSLALALILSRRRLRSVANTIIASMFVCHLCYSFFYTIPYVVFKAVELTGQPKLSPASNIYCQMLIFVFPNVFSINMNFHICAIAMERFISISAPFWYQDVILNWKIIIFITCGIIWITSILIGFYPYLDGLYLWQSTACVPGVTRVGAPYIIPWNIFITLFRFLFPLIFICLFYCRIYCIAKQKTNHLLNHLPQRPRQFGNAFKTAKVIAIIIGVFIICKLPRDATNLIRTFDHRLGPQEILQRIRYWCEFIGINISSAINPLLYTYLNHSFRKELKLLIRRYKVRRDKSYLSTRDKPSQPKGRIRSSKTAECVLLNQRNKANQDDFGCYQDGDIRLKNNNRYSITANGLEKSTLHYIQENLSTQERLVNQHRSFLDNGHYLGCQDDDIFGLRPYQRFETVV